MPFIDLEQDAPRLVQHFRHALALNEGRAPFAPTLWQSNAHSSNTDASFLEAWFFGYHTDVGGGNPRRGLALWPLQWMLAAAIDKGLVLNQTSYKQLILFTGKQHPLNMPHEPDMQMYDMMSHHAASGRYRILLHETDGYMQTEPRNYRPSLTPQNYSPTLNPASYYTGVPSPRVSIHASAYLLFNISSQFRLQLYAWKWFRNFVRDHARAIPILPPWWELETEKNILAHSLPARQMRMLIFGKAGIGKLDLINNAFSPGAAAITQPKQITDPVVLDGNKLIQVYFAPGFTIDSLATVTTFVANYTGKTEVEDQLHVIW